MRVVFCIITILLVGAASFAPAYAVRVIWLQNAKGRATFESGFTAMQNKFRKAEDDIHDKLWDVKHVYVDEQKIFYDDKNFHITVELHGRVLPEFNDKTACTSMLTKAKTVLFGSRTMTALQKYFPGVRQEDLQYFVVVQANLDSYTMRGSSKAIAPEKAKNKEEIEVSLTTACHSYAPSEIVFYGD